MVHGEALHVWFQLMGLGGMQVRSRALRRSVTFSFYLPDPGDGGPESFLALLQLHGAYDNHLSWIINSKLPVYLEQVPLIAIMPDGALSRWSNWPPNDSAQRYEDFIMEDLLPACEHFFPIRSGRWAIGGLSMGGYGALRLGLKYPHHFASIYAHSSVFYGHEPFTESAPVLSPEERADTDIYTHADRAVGNESRPTLGFDCGTDDGLVDQNRSFHAHLESIGYPHQYREPAGAHTWEYWDEHVRHALQQHMEVLR